MIRHWRAFSLLALLALFVALADQLAAQPPPPEQRQPAVRRITLGNGMRLLVLPNDSSEIVSLVALCQVGQTNETPEQAGLAALTAETMIRGTENRPGRAFVSLVGRAGGNIRAVAGPDFSEFQIVTDRARWEPAVRLMADIIARPAFGAEELDAAREAIRRRQLADQDDFHASSYQALVGLLYANGPYGRPVTGEAETLARLGREDARRFWQEHYLQNRITLAIVGNVDVPALTRLAQRELESVPFRPDPAPRPPAAPALARPEVEILERSGPAAQLMIGFTLPPVDAERYATYLVLEALLGGGRRSRLYANIREAEGLGYSLGATYVPLLGPSHIVGHVVTSPFRLNPDTGEAEGVLEKVRQLLEEQFRALAGEEGVSDAELARARAYALGRHVIRQERTREQARWLAWSEAVQLEVANHAEFAARIEAVTAEDVREVARELLREYALVVTVQRTERGGGG